MSKVKNSLENAIDNINQKITIPEEYCRYIYLFTLIVFIGYIISIFSNYNTLQDHVEILVLVITSISFFLLSILLGFSSKFGDYSFIVSSISLLLLVTSILLVTIHYDKGEIKNNEPEDPVLLGIISLYTYIVSSMVTHKGEM